MMPMMYNGMQRMESMLAVRIRQDAGSAHKALAGMGKTRTTTLSANNAHRPFVDAPLHRTENIFVNRRGRGCTARGR